MLRRLDRNEIRNSRCRIGPEVRPDLPGRAQAYIDVIGDALRAQPELQSTRTIDRGHECRTVDLLLKMRVDDARNCGNTPPQLLRYAQVGRAIPADGPDIDLRRQSEIKDLGDHVRSLKIERHFRKRGRQHLAQLADVAGGRGVPLFECHQDHAVVRANSRTVGERKVVHTLRYPDVVDNEVTLPLGNDLSNLILDRLEDAFGRFDSGAGGRANVKLDLPSVDGRKEIAAGQRKHDGSQRDDQDGGHRDNEPPRKQQLEHVDVTFAQALEAAFEAAVQVRKPASRIASISMALA